MPNSEEALVTLDDEETAVGIEGFSGYLQALADEELGVVHKADAAAEEGDEFLGPTFFILRSNPFNRKRGNA